ncbi:MAG: hypothetical protein CL751_04775 [Chloroflexi bacterium]|nr:hypothetical protein [Chloroflexota bacterium]
MKFNKLFLILASIALFALIACESDNSDEITYTDPVATAIPITSDDTDVEPEIEEPLSKVDDIVDIDPEPTLEPVATAIPIASDELDPSSEIKEALSKVENIIDPDNISWPRNITVAGNEIVIEERPDNVLTISLGHDEILFGISDDSQIVGTTIFAQEEGSNIKNKSYGLPTITTDPESIITLDPDIVFADPYASVELIDTLTDLGILVIQTPLNNDISGRKNDVWFMAYITGNLDQAQTLIEDIDNKINVLSDITENNNVKKKVLTLSWWDSYWTAGTGSTEDSIINLAGAINIASENGIESNTTIDKEKLISMNPEIILITQSVAWGGQDFYDQLFLDTSLSSIEAIKNNNVFLVNPNWWGTLSYWNIMGAKQLIEILLPDPELDDFGGF